MAWLDIKGSFVILKPAQEVCQAKRAGNILRYPHGGASLCATGAYASSSDNVLDAVGPMAKIEAPSTGRPGFRPWRRVALAPLAHPHRSSNASAGDDKHGGIRGLRTDAPRKDLSVKEIADDAIC
jgi:hypothetical protein